MALSRTMLRPPALVAAVRHGLVPYSTPVEIADNDAARLVGLAQHDHLSGFLAESLLDGALTASEQTGQMIHRNWHQELMSCVRLEALVVRAASMLDGGGVRWRLTKGAAVAHLDYPDPTVRTFGDVDIIVHPLDWVQAVESLEGGGLRREAPSLGWEYDRRYGKGATLVTDARLQVDLHRRFAIGRFGVTSKMEDLFEGGETISLASREIPVLNAEQRLLHACFHATLGGFRRLRAFRDVAQMILVTKVDWTATLSIARRWQAEAVVASALCDTWQLLDLDRRHPAHSWASSLQVSRGDRRAIAVFQAERGFRSQALTAIGRLPVPAIPRYLWALGEPSLRRRMPLRDTPGSLR